MHSPAVTRPLSYLHENTSRSGWFLQVCLSLLCPQASCCQTVKQNGSKRTVDRNDKLAGPNDFLLVHGDLSTVSSLHFFLTFWSMSSGLGLGQCLSVGGFLGRGEDKRCGMHAGLFGCFGPTE